MAKKIKLSEAAKDLNIPAQELIGYFTEKGDTKKKAASTLTEEEMNEILEHYTKLHEVKNLDEYFATANEPRPEKKKTAAKQLRKRRKRSLPLRRTKKLKNRLLRLTRRTLLRKRLLPKSLSQRKRQLRLQSPL